LNMSVTGRNGRPRTAGSNAMRFPADGPLSRRTSVTTSDLS